jgi:hypothetical protein
MVISKKYILILLGKTNFNTFAALCMIMNTRNYNEYVGCTLLDSIKVVIW